MALTTKKIIVEICKTEARKTSVKQALKEGYYNIWTPERIKNAFNYGNGSIKDFKRYKKDNANYIIIREYSPEELQELTPFYNF